MPTHASRQVLDIVIAALKATVTDAKVLEEDPRSITFDDVGPGGVVTIHSPEEPIEDFSPDVVQTTPRYRCVMDLRVTAIATSAIQRDALRFDMETALANVPYGRGQPIANFAPVRAQREQSGEAQKSLWALQLHCVLEYHILATDPDVALTS